MTDHLLGRISSSSSFVVYPHTRIRRQNVPSCFLLANSPDSIITAIILGHISKYPRPPRRRRVTHMSTFKLNRIQIVFRQHHNRCHQQSANRRAIKRTGPRLPPINLIPEIHKLRVRLKPHHCAPGLLSPASSVKVVNHIHTEHERHKLRRTLHRHHLLPRKVPCAD